MNETTLAILGITSGVLNLLASIPYFLDIFRGNTKPERATWWMWFILSFVGLFAQAAGGAKWSLVLSLTSTLVGGATALLSIKYGFGRFHRRDAVGLMIAGLGIVFSFVFRNSIFAVLTIVLIESVAGGLTVYKTWYAPRTENLTAWSISTIGVTCGFLAVGQYRPVIFLSPLSNVTINVLMLSVIIYRRGKVKHQPIDV